MDNPEGPLDDPPDGGYGWVVCAAVSSINGFTWGVTSSYGVYLSHYLSTSSFPTSTPLDYAFIGGIQFGSAFLISPLATILTRTIARKPIMTVGCVVYLAGFLAASFATEIWHLYLSQGLLIGFGQGFIFVPCIQVLPQWFLRRRSLAQGLASAGSGVGGLAFSLGTDAMIERISWAWALRITGVVAFVGNLCATAVIRDRNHVVKPPQLGFVVHLLKSLSNYAVSVVGLSQSQAGLLTALLNLGTGVGRPAIGSVSDCFGRIETAAVLTLVSGISTFAIWVPANSHGVLIFFSLFAGATLGVFWNTAAPICAEVAGLQELPSFLNLQWLVIVLPTTFAEVAALRLRKPEMGRWGYLYAQIFAGLSYIVGSLFLFELWRIRRKAYRAAKSEMGRRNNVERFIAAA